MNEHELTQDEKNNIACDFMAHFGGLHTNNINPHVKADEVMQWAVTQVEKYRESLIQEQQKL